MWFISARWNSSPLVHEVTKRGKKKKMLTGMTFSLIHATDFADRTEHHIIPPLKAGAVVLADRYIYTAFARDVARGVSPKWVRDLYAFAVKPTVAFYFRTPLDVAMKRILGGRDALKYYEAGMDLGLSDDIEESFGLFQSRIIEEYEKMIDEFGLGGHRRDALDRGTASGSAPYCIRSIGRHQKRRGLDDGWI